MELWNRNVRILNIEGEIHQVFIMVTKYGGRIRMKKVNDEMH